MRIKRKKVLITGSCGLIGKVLISAFHEKYELSGIDINSLTSTDIKVETVDISKFDRMLPYFKNIDTVIHLAANAPVTTPWADALRNNINGTRNVYEACIKQGVKRVVFASSNHTVGLYENDEPYKNIVSGKYKGLSPGCFTYVDHTSPIRPDSNYGISKAFGEAMGRYYSEVFGLEVACLRIGTLNKIDNPTQDVRHYATWLSHNDAAQLFSLCIDKPLKYEIFYGVSNNKWKFWDISYAHRIIGYLPKDNAENWR